MQNISLSEIAKQLSISASTVSRALRDHPDIAPATKAKVKKIADELGFQPSILAKSLVQKKTRMIGAIVPEISSTFFPKVINGFYKVAREKGYKVLLMVSNENEKTEQDLLRFFTALSVDGILVSVTQNTQKTDVYKHLHKRQLPIVFYDRILKGLDISTVTTDDRTGVRELTEHLLKNGYQRIAFMGPTGRPSIAVDRYFGYRDVFVSHDYLMGKEWVITSKIDEIDAYQTMQDIIVGGKIPQAIVCVNDGVALGAYRAIVEADLKIPDDIALAGYGNTLSTDLLPVPLTTIEQPASQLGEKAIALLLDEIESDAEPQDIVLKTNILLRDSTHKYTHFYNSDTIQMQTTKNITG